MTSSPPIYNGTDYQNQPLVDAWWTRGWTSQNDAYVEAAQPNQYPNFPSNLKGLNVSAAYFDMDGNPLPGFLTFQMSDNITVLDNGAYFRMPQRYAGNENDGSAFSLNNFGSGRIYIWKGLMQVVLFCTDNAGITTDGGAPFVWNVAEHFMGGRTFQITAPSADVPGPTDINTLIVPGTVQAADFDPASPLGFS